MGTPWPTPVCADMVLLPLLLLLGAVSTSHGALQQIKQGKKVVALFEGDENGEGKAWYPLYEGGFAKGIPNKRGKVSLPGGATYLGKFSKGKPVGKGRLVDLAKKKQKGKFSTMSEVINRMFTKDCDVGITFPDKVVTKGFPASCAERHNSTHKKNLFLGNSYTGGNSGLPAKVISLARGAGFSASVSSVTPGGQTFAGHGTSSINTVTGTWLCSRGRARGAALALATSTITSYLRLSSSATPSRQQIPALCHSSTRRGAREMGTAIIAATMTSSAHTRAFRTS